MLTNNSSQLRSKVIPGPPLFSNSVVEKFLMEPPTSSGSITSYLASTLFSSKNSPAKKLPSKSASKDSAFLGTTNFTSRSAQTVAKELKKSGEFPMFEKYETSDWSLNNLLAVASQKYVMIYEPSTLQTVQSLVGHTHRVTCVKWNPTINEKAKDSNSLVSGDEAGNVLLWDFRSNQILCHLNCFFAPDDSLDLTNSPAISGQSKKVTEDADVINPVDSPLPKTKQSADEDEEVQEEKNEPGLFNNSIEQLTKWYSSQQKTIVSAVAGTIGQNTMPQKPDTKVIALRFLPEDSNYLLALTFNGMLTLFSLERKQRVWNYMFPEPVFTISFSPFSDSVACFPSRNGSVFFMYDLSVNMPPAKVEKRLTLSLGANNNQNEGKSSKKKKNSSFSDGTNADFSSAVFNNSQIRDVQFSPFHENQVFIVTQQDVSLYDLEIRQVLKDTRITLKELKKSVTTSSLNRIFFPKFVTPPDNKWIYLCHEDGMITAFNLITREKRSCDSLKSLKFGGDRGGLFYSIAFAPLHHNPGTQKMVAVSSDNKLWFWTFVYGNNCNYNKNIVNLIQNLENPTKTKEILELKEPKKEEIVVEAPAKIEQPQITSNSEVVELQQPQDDEDDEESESEIETETEIQQQPQKAAQNLDVSTSKWTLRGFIESISSLITSSKVNDFNQSEIAIGTANGIVYIMNLKTNDITKKFEVFLTTVSSSILDIQWVSPSEIIFFTRKLVQTASDTDSGISSFVPTFSSNSNSPSGSSGDDPESPNPVPKQVFMNYLMVVNTKSGKFSYLRREKEKDSTCIKQISLSSSKKFLLVYPMGQPLELWEMSRNPSLLSVIPLNFIISTMQWTYSAILQPNSKSLADILAEQANLEQNFMQNQEIQRIPKNSKENFTICDNSGFVFTYGVDLFTKQATNETPTVKGNVVKFLQNSGKSIASNSEYLCIAEDNFIHVFRADKKNTKIPTNHVVKKICLPSAGPINYNGTPNSQNPASEALHYLLILFEDNFFTIMNLKYLQKVGKTSPVIHCTLDVEWAVPEASNLNLFPISIEKAGSVIVYSLTTATHVNPESGNSQKIIFLKCGDPILKNCFELPVRTPALLSKTHYQFLKYLMFELDNGALNFDAENVLKSYKNGAESLKDFRNCYGELVNERIAKEKKNKNLIYYHMALVPNIVKRKCLDEKIQLVDKYLQLSLYFADEFSISFWQKVKNYANFFQTHKDTLPIEVFKEEFEIIQQKILKNEQKPAKIDENEEENDENGTIIQDSYSLPEYFGILRSFDQQKVTELSKLSKIDATIRENLQNSQISPNAPVLKENVMNSINSIAQKHAIYGNKKNAVSLLLQTPHSHPSSQLNFLEAMIISASVSEEDFHQTVKLIASVMLSKREEKSILKAVEYFCLIGEYYKACQMLQNFDFWNESIQLAKMKLTGATKQNLKQYNQIMMNYAEHLMNNGKFEKALDIWMSIGCFVEVLNVLHLLQRDDLASYFVNAMEELKIPICSKLFISQSSKFNSLENSNFGDFVKPEDRESLKNPKTLEELIEMDKKTKRKTLYFVYNSFSNVFKSIHWKEKASSYENLIDLSKEGIEINENDLKNERKIKTADLGLLGTYGSLNQRIMISSSNSSQNLNQNNNPSLSNSWTFI